MNTSIRTAYKKAVDKTKDQHKEAVKDDFLNLEEYLQFKHDAAKRHLKQALMEISELVRDKKWEDAISLFYPLDEKFPGSDKLSSGSSFAGKDRFCPWTVETV